MLPDELAAKSTALQGLPALEYLLYGGGAEATCRHVVLVDHLGRWVRGPPIPPLLTNTYTGKGGSRRCEARRLPRWLFAIECDLSATETLDGGGTVLL